MKSSPVIIDGASVLCWAETAGIEKTGACTFRADVEEQSQFAGVAIAQYKHKPNSGCDVFFCDENWETQNDSLHRDFDEARAFSESLYPGISARWQSVPTPRCAG